MKGFFDTIPKELTNPRVSTARPASTDLGA